MDGKCQECIAITSVVATTIDLADLATSTGISVAPASAVVAASNSAHPAANDTALDTAPVADGTLHIYAVDLGLHQIPSPLREAEVADPRRPPREIEAPDGVVTYGIAEESSIRGKVCNLFIMCYVIYMYI